MGPVTSRGERFAEATARGLRSVDAAFVVLVFSGPACRRCATLVSVMGIQSIRNSLGV
jgi:hypothetical protein